MSSSKFIGAIALAVLLVGCSTSSRKAAVQEENLRKPAPQFTLEDATGAKVTLADYKGKVVLLNFWATWCAPCKIEIPWFMEFEKTYKDRDFAVLGLAMDDDGWKSVKPYVEQHKLNYRILVGTEVVSKLYGDIDSLPTTFILDRDGRIAKEHLGLAGKGEYLNEILTLLDAPKPADAPKHAQSGVPGGADLRLFPALLRAN
jgi:peroxiredoxin